MKRKKGFVLIVAMSFLTMLLVGGSSYVYMVTTEAKAAERQVNTEKAFFLAEAGMEKAVWRIKNDSVVESETFRLKGGSAALNYLDDNDITVTMTDLGNGVYQVASFSQVGFSAKTLNATMQKNPPAAVFDYAYFINNWGWFYGNGIDAKGDVRSNGRFDFRDRPGVSGDIYAGFEIDDGGDGIRGSGGDADHQHPDSEKLEMPNLYDTSYYEDLAKTEGGTIKVNGVTLIDGVFGDDSGESGNIVLVGTSSDPIEIDGPVVVRGDVVVKGTIKGQGTLYAGRNIYVANDVNYKNAPSSPRPASDDPSVTDGWVEAHKDDDLVGFAATESIILGDYTGKTGGSWSAGSYLYRMGDEDVGEDGIPDTNDAHEDDGIFQAQYEDLDADGARDYDYTWSNVQTQVPITSFANCPAGVSVFGDLATNRVSKIDGVFYTNHAVAGKLGGGAVINGAVISKDEAMIYTNTLTFNYDERINSRYTTGENRIIDVFLPVSKKVEIIRWWE
ncbi:MAG: pilus assembly PilX N-terminal domain-containing protein [Candidatus Omnitrophota bacterium]